MTLRLRLDPIRAALVAAAATAALASAAGCGLLAPTGVVASAAETRLAVTGLPAATCRVVDAGTTPRAARHTGPVVSTLRYGSDGSQPLYGVLRIPATTSVDALPVVLLVHGGGWMHGDMSEMDPAVTALGAAGIATFNIDYGLATEAEPGFPRALDDIAQAVRFLRARAAAFGVDGSRIGAIGSSAGANLVSLLATTGQGSCLSGARLAAVVSWSAPFDVADYGSASAGQCEVAAAACGHLAQEARSYIGCSYVACPHEWQQASVAPHVTPDDPPMLLFTSNKELIPAEQARDVAEVLQREHVPHQLVVLPGGRHAASYAKTALPLSIEFLRTYLEPSPSA